MSNLIEFSSGVSFEMRNIEHTSDILNFEVAFSSFDAVADIIQKITNSSIKSCNIEGNYLDTFDLSVQHVSIKDLVNKTLLVECIHTHAISDKDLDAEIQVLEDEVARLEAMVQKLRILRS